MVKNEKKKNCTKKKKKNEINSRQVEYVRKSVEKNWMKGKFAIAGNCQCAWIASNTMGISHKFIAIIYTKLCVCVCVYHRNMLYRVCLFWCLYFIRVHIYIHIGSDGNSYYIICGFFYTFSLLVGSAHTFVYCMGRVANNKNSCLTYFTRQWSKMRHLVFMFPRKRMERIEKNEKEKKKLFFSFSSYIEHLHINGLSRFDVSQYNIWNWIRWW